MEHGPPALRADSLPTESPGKPNTEAVIRKEPGSDSFTDPGESLGMAGGK